MGFMDRLLSEGGSRNQHTADDYVELDIDDFETDVPESGTSVHVAQLGSKQDVIIIKDAIYDGDIVIADITRHSTTDRTMEHITDELKQVVNEVGGDIVQKDDDQLIITPSGVGISRKKLGY
ncbi:cell division protein SepF [Halocatena marina]|uniref:Cell division protein SepF n=1 Tax=Halocatena marina TaxID=2934937 RepID=A0ABD5YRD1_9EURY|nr:cell division protein SepF [Halocatena marina]